MIGDTAWMVQPQKLLRYKAGVSSGAATPQSIPTCMDTCSAPWLFLRPRPLNQEGPLRRMVGATATVSTLVTVDGQPYRPTLAGKGGLRRGLPCLPSRLSMRAVSSPARSCVSDLRPWGT